LELSLEDKEKTISDLKNQQVESKRVELITLERNLEDKHRLELEQVKSDSLAKMNDLRKKNEFAIQKALNQQKEEFDTLLSTNVINKVVDNTSDDKLKMSNEIVKQKNRDIAQLEEAMEKKNSDIEDREEEIKKGRQSVLELQNMLQQEKDKNYSKIQVLEENIKSYEKQITDKKGEMQDLKLKYEQMETHSKWKRKELKRKFNEEKDKLDAINKDMKSQLDVCTSKYEAQIETMKSNIDQQKLGANIKISYLEKVASEEVNKVKQQLTEVNEAIEKERAQYKEKLKVLEQDLLKQNQCKICQNKKRSKAVLPCMHYCYCDVCVGNLKECKVCGVSVVGWLKVKD